MREEIEYNPLTSFPIFILFCELRFWGSLDCLGRANRAENDLPSCLGILGGTTSVTSMIGTVHTEVDPPWFPTIAAESSFAPPLAFIRG